MNESRKDEIEGIIERLQVIESELRQIQLADSLSKTPAGQAWEVRITADRIRTDISGLEASIR
jgi:hypothetical protein